MAKKKAVAKIKKTQKKTAKKKVAVVKARDYDNSTRSEKSNTNRQKILELYINLLVDGNGQDIPLQVLAKKSKTSMRTLFRFFGDKESLNREITGYLTKFMPAVHENLGKLNFEEYTEFSYSTFDEYEKLFRAYLYTSFGQKSRAIFRQEFMQLLVRKVRSELGVEKLSPENMLRVHLIVCLVNANIWNDMRESFQLSGADIARVCRWGIRTLLNELKREVHA